MVLMWAGSSAFWFRPNTGTTPLPKTNMQKTLFFSDINNQGTVKNSSYAENLSLLSSLVLVKFKDDTVVDPRGSELFSWFSESGNMVPLNETRLYTEDWIGLKAMDEAGKLHLMEVPGDHLQLSQDSLDMIITTYLDN